MTTWQDLAEDSSEVLELKTKTKPDPRWERFAADPNEVVDMRDWEFLDPLRAWMRGGEHLALDSDLIARLCDPDVILVGGVLRSCVATGCLDLDTWRGVLDLVSHQVRVHRIGRLTDRATRGMELLLVVDATLRRRHGGAS